MQARGAVQCRAARVVIIETCAVQTFRDDDTSHRA